MEILVLQTVALDFQLPCSSFWHVLVYKAYVDSPEYCQIPHFAQLHSDFMIAPVMIIVSEMLEIWEF